MKRSLKEFDVRRKEKSLFSDFYGSLSDGWRVVLKNQIAFDYENTK